MFPKQCIKFVLFYHFFNESIYFLLSSENGIDCWFIFLSEIMYVFLCPIIWYPYSVASKAQEETSTNDSLRKSKYIFYWFTWIYLENQLVLINYFPCHREIHSSLSGLQGFICSLKIGGELSKNSTFAEQVAACLPLLQKSKFNPYTNSTRINSSEQI